MVRAEFVSLGVPEHEDVHGNDYVPRPCWICMGVLYESPATFESHMF